MRNTYTKALHAILTSHEHAVLKKLTTPQKIQDYLDTLPINFETKGETYMSPRRVIETGTAHCFEGALFAAATCAYHGAPPLLMDFRTVPSDEDHVIALFRYKGRWGAFSKTNHSILRYRDPIYLSPRELALSYFHEYLEWNGRKSLRTFSHPFDLSRYNPKKWVTATEELLWLVTALDTTRHYAALPKSHERMLRKATLIELTAMKIIEWDKGGKKLLDSKKENRRRKRLSLGG